jgi:hypothetical protein
MPEDMYRHEHPGHIEEARRETERVIEKRIERMRRRKNNHLDESTPPTADTARTPDAAGRSRGEKDEA